MASFDRSLFRVIVYRQAFGSKKTRVIRDEQLHFHAWYTLQHSLGHGSIVSCFEGVTMRSVFLRKITGQHRVRSPERRILRLWGTTSYGRVMVKE